MHAAFTKTQSFLGTHLGSNCGAIHWDYAWNVLHNILPKPHLGSSHVSLLRIYCLVLHKTLALVISDSSPQQSEHTTSPLEAEIYTHLQPPMNLTTVARLQGTSKFHPSPSLRVPDRTSINSISHCATDSGHGCFPVETRWNRLAILALLHRAHPLACQSTHSTSKK